jgi:hypothetical protein
MVLVRIMGSRTAKCLMCLLFKGERCFIVFYSGFIRHLTSDVGETVLLSEVG